MSHFSKRLIEYRRIRKLTVKQVAENLGIPATTYRDWEYGNAITGEPYLKLANLFQISLYELLTGERLQKNQVAVEMKEIIDLQKKLLVKINNIL